MADSYAYEVFLSHSAKDKAVVRPLAERLRADGLKVWFDEWVLKPGDSIPAKIEEGLEHSRVLVLCTSAQAFGSDWAQLEAGTFRFRDPLNKERRFIPLRLDDAPIKGSLAQFLYINWSPADREQEYAKLLEACRPLPQPAVGEWEWEQDNGTQQEAVKDAAAKKVGQLQYGAIVFDYGFSSDATRAFTASGNLVAHLWDIKTGRRIHAFEHGGLVERVVCTQDCRLAISGCNDGMVRLWDTTTGQCLKRLETKEGNRVLSLSWSADRRFVLSSYSDGAFRLWDLTTGSLLHELEGHNGSVSSSVWASDTSRALSASEDMTVRLWNVETGQCLRVLEGHTGGVTSVTWSSDNRFALSCANDRTLRLWDVGSGRCIEACVGHKDQPTIVEWTSDLRFAVSVANNELRLWDLRVGRCACVLDRPMHKIKSVKWLSDQRRVICGDEGGGIWAWDLSDFDTGSPLPGVFPYSRTDASTAGDGSGLTSRKAVPDQVQYTNAKVLLVGESGVGKTGLSRRLTVGAWEPSDSTVGAWATQWKLPVASSEDTEREIWLWDFGGQADQRLIHQLYMDGTALAVLVFDGQKEDIFETLGQWDRDLVRASRKDFARLLVAGRVDAGGLRVSRSEVEKFAADRKFRGFLETSAKKNQGCEELKQAILAGINWDELPCRTTEVLFKRLKEEIIRLKDEGRVLMRFNELRETLQMRLSGEFKRFADDELRTVLTLLAGPGVVWELAFGSWVLLQPERINAYAQAVIRTLQADEHQRGCLMEERVLKGELDYAASVERLKDREEERFVLLAMHQTLVERGLCLRQPTDKGNLLVFPSYYRRERPNIVQHPAVNATYRFTGFLDEIYATLVVRLHHTVPFQQDQLWRYAADFKTQTGKQLGVKLTRRAPGIGDLDVYFDASIAMEERIIFCKYVHEHLLQEARNVERLRHYVCKCGMLVGNREVAMKRLNDWLQARSPQPDAAARFKLHKSKEEPPSIICVDCEQRVPLWDAMEQCFASPEIQHRVRDLQEESKIVLDNQSKERALVGEVISTVALANQISREFNVSDQGIDMEIEFKDDAHEATGAKLYLQLKSGDSYLRERKSDGAEIFTIKDERHARYWMAQAFPVLLVIRNAEGEVRWMEVRDWLKCASDNGRKPVKQIVFEGERFDVMSVRRWREKLLSGAVA